MSESRIVDVQMECQASLQFDGKQMEKESEGIEKELRCETLYNVDNV